MKDWMKWGLVGGLIGILAPLAMGPGLEDTSSIFYFFGLSKKIVMLFAPSGNVYSIVSLWIMQFLLGFLIASVAGSIYARYKK